MVIKTIDMTVIIPTYNSSLTIDRCLNSLIHQDFPKKQVEIVVVDDGSTDNTVRIVKGYFLKTLKVSRSGPYKARNFGAKQANGKILVFTDSDCIHERDWLTRIKNRFENTKIDAIQGPGNLTKQKNIWVQAECARQPMTKSFFWGDTKNLAVRKSVFSKLGGFDERFSTGGDAEFVYRLRKNRKHIIYDENLRVYHQWSENIVLLFKSAIKYAFGDFLIDRKMRQDSIRKKIVYGIRSPKWTIRCISIYLDFMKRQSYSTIEKIKIFFYILINMNFRYLIYVFLCLKYHKI